MALRPRKLTDSDTCRQSWVMLFLSLARAGGREGQRKRNRRERQIRSLCEIARPGFKFGVLILLEGVQEAEVHLVTRRHQGESGPQGGANSRAGGNGPQFPPCARLPKRLYMNRVSNNHPLLFSCFFHAFLKEHVCLWLGFPREKAMAPHSSTLAWKIPWTEEPVRLQSMGSLRVGDD